MSPRLNDSCAPLGALRCVDLPRFRGHRNICVGGVHDGEDKPMHRSSVALQNLFQIALLGSYH